ncbi:MAG: hypothetical protein RRC34_11645 [Lentisphaeria bacterium]|nr:hypothetical protein [Lentisphaeria bacterium]
MAKKAKKTSPSTIAPSSAASKKTKKKKVSAPEPPVDAMSTCIALCQEQKWREALLLSRQSAAAAEKGESADGFAGLGPAETKIEYSLRRQMAGGIIVAAKHMLAKEYLLDVGE